MATVQSKDAKACFVFDGDFNAHHVEWLGSVSPTDCHGIAAHDFANSSGCQQLVDGPTHTCGNRLDLVLTDVPGAVGVEVRAPIGTLDHSALCVDLTLEQQVPQFSVRREFYLKGRVCWDAVRDDLTAASWGAVYRSPKPEVAFSDVLLDVVRRRVPSKVLRMRSTD